ncbi:MAG: glycine cleavage system aminomethyltransferase GcvT [Dehalococcoidia bacterium]|nr:glycine cleavage system aminomethyltransferase GcvT [Dehalococcoidia bacterium]
MTHGAASALRQLTLRDRHIALGARIAPFAGWEMPLQYEGVLEEHHAVRERAGMFDVSHMGRVRLEGARAGELLRSVTTFDVRRLEVGEAHYSLYCTEDGGIADDVFVYRLGEARWLVVQNAANAEAGTARLRAAMPSVDDVTVATVMLAVQGPEAMAALERVFGTDGRLAAVAPRRCLETAWRGETALLARTGYTGEDGMECIVPAAAGGALWDALLAAGVRPAGLAARDTLRLEAALPLHGHEIDETTTPFEAGLGFAVTLEDGAPFTGRAALERLHAQEQARKLACIRLSDRGVPRAGMAVLDATGATVSTLTSGTFSPTLRAGIGMAYLPVALATAGTPVQVQVRDRATAAEVVRRPFYRRPRA